MPKHKGNDHTSLMLRQEKVFRLMLRQLNPREIAEQINAGELRKRPKERHLVTYDQVRRDVEVLRDQLSEIAQLSELRGIKEAIAEKREILKEGWHQYHRKPYQFPLKVQSIKEGKQRTEIVWIPENDRLPQLAALNVLKSVSVDLDMITGLRSEKYIDSLTFVSTPQGMGVKIEHIPLNTQLKKESARMTDEEARAEGIA